MVRGDLCTALVTVLNLGFKTKRFFGTNHIWDIFGLAADNVRTAQSAGLQAAVKSVTNLVKRSQQSGDKDVMFRTLVCFALKFLCDAPFLHSTHFHTISNHMLSDMVSLSLSCPQVLEDLYEEESPMQRPATVQLLQKALERLDKLPFKLTLEYELSPPE